MAIQHNPASIPLLSLDAIAFDSETTGLDTSQARMIQLGAVGISLWGDAESDLDAVTAVSWRMKKKVSKTRWAALRVGFSGADWASPWLMSLAECNLPAADFVMKAADASMGAFKESPASFYDAQSAMRILLIGSSFQMTNEIHIAPDRVFVANDMQQSRPQIYILY